MSSHTVVAVDAGTGRQLDELTVTADEAGHRRLLGFAAQMASFGSRTAKTGPGST